MSRLNCCVSLGLLILTTSLSSYELFFSVSVCAPGAACSAVCLEMSISTPIYTVTLSHENKALFLQSKVFIFSFSFSFQFYCCHTTVYVSIEPQTCESVKQQRALISTRIFCMKHIFPHRNPLRLEHHCREMQIMSLHFYHVDCVIKAWLQKYVFIHSTIFFGL